MTKILIIEDQVDMRYLLEWQVELMGFVALSTKNEVEGVKIAITEKPDLILMDIMCSKASFSMRNPPTKALRSCKTYSAEQSRSDCVYNSI